MKLMIRVRAGLRRDERPPAVPPRPLLAALGLMVAAAVPAGAQIRDGWTIGPVLQYSYGVPVAIARDSGIVNHYNSRLTGLSSDHAPAIGIQLRRPLLLQLERPVGLTLEALVGRSIGSFSSDPIPLGALLTDPTTLLPVEPKISVDVTSRPWFLRFAGSLDYHWLDAMSIGLGVWAQYRFSSNFVSTERLVDYEPQGVVFETPPDSGRRSRVVMSGAVLGSSPFRIGPSVSLTFPMSLAPGIDLLPGLSAQLDLGAILDGLGLRAGRIGAGLSVAFRLPDAESSPPGPSDQIPVLAMPREGPREQAPTLEADVTLYSEGTGDSSRAALSVRREVRRSVVPLVPEIYFDPASASLPEPYVRLDPEAAHGFSVRGLARADVARIYYHTLNILGSRLRERPAARIEIVGSIGAGEPLPLARQRAEAVRKYLADVWKVEQDRMTISTGEQRNEESDERRRRAVVVTGNDPAIFDPVVTSWIEEEMSLPSVRLANTVRAASGVRRWTLTALHGSTEVARYEGTTLEELRDVSVAFALRTEPGARELPPLAAELQVEDLTGRVAIARGELPLVRPSGTADPSAEIISVLVLPDGAEELLRGVAGALRDGAAITVLRSPDREYAERSTSRPEARASEIAAQLRSLARARRVGATVEMRDVGTGTSAATGLAGLAYQGSVSVEIVQRMPASTPRLRP